MSAFWAGFEKRAGILQRLVDKARSGITGMERVYHGTSNARAKDILKKGLTPNVKGGISEKLPVPGLSTVADLNQGLVFTTRDKGIAKGYAKQQAALDTIEKAHSKLKAFSEKRKAQGKGGLSGTVSEVLDELPAVKALAAQQYARLPLVPGGKVLKMDLPKDVMKKSVPNPEIKVRKNQADLKLDLLPIKGKNLLRRLVHRNAEAPFKHDVAFQGKIKPHFIKE